jgi:hypothetical protein
METMGLKRNIKVDSFGTTGRQRDDFICQDL